MAQNVLVIAPHADDEVLGCGGSIARHVSRGDSVHVLVITHGAPDIFPEPLVQQIRQEMYAAHQLLGVHETRVLDFHAPKLDTVPGYEIADAIARVVRDLTPEVVYIPHRGDIHTDHIKVYTASLVATRPINKCSVRRLLSYETLSETDWAPPTGDNAFIPTVFIDISAQLEAKLAAMRCYASQLKPLPSARSLESLSALARLRGGTVGVEAAEAFMLIRHIEL